MSKEFQLKILNILHTHELLTNRKVTQHWLVVFNMWWRKNSNPIANKSNPILQTQFIREKGQSHDWIMVLFIFVHNAVYAVVTASTSKMWSEKRNRKKREWIVKPMGKKTCKNEKDGFQWLFLHVDANERENITSDQRKKKEGYHTEAVEEISCSSSKERQRSHTSCI